MKALFENIIFINIDSIMEERVIIFIILLMMIAIIMITQNDIEKISAFQCN